MGRGLVQLRQLRTLVPRRQTYRVEAEKATQVFVL